jgi:hypothetical protein
VGGALFETDARSFLADENLAAEIFGPATLLVRHSNREEVLEAARNLDGHLTATIHGTEQDLEEFSDLIAILERKVGRLVFNGFPTGVEVSHAMVHGGPYPATSDGRSTSVGSQAIFRFCRPVCYQGFPQAALPDALKDANPLHYLANDRRRNDERTNSLCSHTDRVKMPERVPIRDNTRATRFLSLSILFNGPSATTVHRSYSRARPRIGLRKRN